MASAQQVPQVQTDSRTDNQLQTNIGIGLSKLLSGPFAVTSLVQAKALASGSNVVNHNLGQTPTGYIVTKRNGTATIYDTAFTSATVTLVASASITCDILFF